MTIGLAGLALAGALPAGASAAAAQGSTRIQSPSANQIVADGSVHVAVRSGSNLRTLRASVNGRDVERYFHHVAGGYRGTLRLGRGLRYGVNNLIVVTGGYRDFDQVSFVVARHAPQLLTLTSLRVDGPEAPVRVAVRAAPGNKLYAWINGHRNTGAFKPEGGRYVGRFGANDFLRPGRNHLVVRVAHTHRSGRSAVHDTVERTFVIDRGELAASAGRDRVVRVGQPIVLHGDVDSVGGPESDERGVEYRWRIVSDPPGRPATLRGLNSRTPAFLPHALGRYRLRATTTLPDGTASVDTATAIVPADVPPIGWRLLTGALGLEGRILLNGHTIPNTAACTDPAQGGLCGLPFQTYAVLDRQTLQLKASGTFYSQVGDFGRLADIAAKYKGAPGYLMVVNSVYTPNQLDPGWTRLLDLLGVPRTSAARDTRNGGPVSIIGVPGAPSGSSFVAAPFMQCDGPCPGWQLLNGARQDGYVRLNPLTPAPGNFEFVYDDQVEFDTDASTVPNQIVIKVGGNSYTYDYPAGSSGFFHVRLDSRTLKPLVTNTFVTNGADLTANPTDINRLAGVLAASADGLAQAKGSTLVLLQAFGTPRGFSSDWAQAAAAVGRLGGTGQVFAWMNTGLRLTPYRGRYALVTRRAMDVPAAENSQSLTNTDGRLHGLLARGRDGQYEPLMADPAGTINFDLVRIVNRQTPTRPTPGGFPEFSSQAAATALGRNVMNICTKPTTANPDPPCDVRRAYWEKNAGTNWDTILTKLSTDPGKTQCETPGPGFSPSECNDVRAQLQLEIAARNTVAEYFGTNGLQAPFGSVEVTSLVDIAKVADEIRNAVKPAPADNATADALTLASYVTKLGAFSTAACPPCSAVASGLGATFGLGAYLTKQDESPDLLGPQVSTTAVNLGKELVERYKNASTYFSTEAEIIMSDWSKLKEVADVATSDPKWALGRVSTTTATISLAAKQAIYQSMVTAAYPVLYNLGLFISHATDWYCRTSTSTRHLFGKTGPDAELVLSESPNVGGTHVLAIGARKTVGTGSTALIPSPPASVTDLLFRPTTDPAGDGLGFFKLSFYSPNNFSLFPTVLQQFRDRSGNLGQPCDSVPNPPGAG